MATELEQLSGNDNAMFVHDIAFSPSGNYLATTSRNKAGTDEVHLYRNAFGGEAIASFRLRDFQAVQGGTPPGPAPVAAISRHGSFVAAAGVSSGLILWKLSEHSEDSGARGKLLQDETIQNKTVTCIRFCPDESMVAYGGSDGRVRLRKLGMVEDDLDTGMHSNTRQAAELWSVRGANATKLDNPPGQSQVHAIYLEFASDASALAVAWKNGNVSLSIPGVKTPVLIKPGLPTSQNIICLSFNYNATKLALVSSNRLVKVVDIIHAKEATNPPTPPTTAVIDLGTHPSDIFACSFSPVENWLVVAATKGAITLWRPARAKGGGSTWQSRALAQDNHPGIVELRSLMMGPRGDIIVAGGFGPAQANSKHNSGIICVWDIRNGTLLRRWVHENSQQVCVLGFDAQTVANTKAGASNKRKRIAESGDDSGELLSCAVASAANMLSVKRWQCERFMLSTPLKPLDGCGAMRSVGFSPDNRLLCCGSGNGMVQTWRTDTSGTSSETERLPLSQLHSDYITALCFATLPLPQTPGPNGEVPSPTASFAVTFPSAALGGGINVPATLMLVCASTDCTVSFSTWMRDLAQWQPIGFLFGHSESVMCVDTTTEDPEHVHVATGSVDCTARVWRARVKIKDSALHILDVSFQQLASLKHPKEVYGVSLMCMGPSSSRMVQFGMNGPATGRLVTGCADGRVRLWNWQTQQQLAVFAGEGPVYSVGLWTPVRKEDKTGGLDKEKGSGKELIAFGCARPRRGADAQVGLLRVAAHEFQRRAVCTMSTGGVERVRFSPDGKVLAVSTAGGQAQLWHAYASNPGLWS